LRAGFRREVYEKTAAEVDAAIAELRTAQAAEMTAFEPMSDK
jgi:hypothetical protein